MRRFHPSRRVFLQALVASGLSVHAGRRVSARIIGANDRVRIAVVGVNGRGQSHLEGWSGVDNVEIAAVVDPHADVLARTMASLEKKATGSLTTQGVSDVRRVLEDPSIDAISIATPNHWHSLMTIWGAQAGKHVYVEKPLSHDVAEGRIAVEAQKKYGVVVQHGTQRRSDPAEDRVWLLLQAAREHRAQGREATADEPRLEPLERARRH